MKRPKCLKSRNNSMQTGRSSSSSTMPLVFFVKHLNQRKTTVHAHVLALLRNALRTVACCVAPLPWFYPADWWVCERTLVRSVIGSERQPATTTNRIKNLPIHSWDSPYRKATRDGQINVEYDDSRLQSGRWFDGTRYVTENTSWKWSKNVW